MLRTVLNWAWAPALITLVAVLGLVFRWPIQVAAPVLGAILVIGLVVVAVAARGRELETSALRLRQLAGYFTRRFTGNSSLSIFAIINDLFKVDNPQLWDWARACDMAQRVFNTWCDSFISRVESDIRNRTFGAFIRLYLNELWQLNTHYYEFVVQFYEIAEKIEIPPETLDQYNRFVAEYNAFVHDFQETIAELKKVPRTQIEPPSVKLARELPVVK
ncbi:MAG: hypothetical protein JSW30_03080 [Dehalococcoidia bacterium]|nr:MAG: hypothetical protein JSW30_03080 [Dehalococcoidia bacterium]